MPETRVETSVAILWALVPTAQMLSWGPNFGIEQRFMVYKHFCNRTSPEAHPRIILPQSFEFCSSYPLPVH